MSSIILRETTVKLSLSNAYLLTGRKTVMVDTGMPGEEMKILRVAERAGVKTGEISLILHTHTHLDHVGSTATLAKMLNLPTAVHHGDLIGALWDVHLPDHQSGAGGPGVDDLGCGFARPGVKRATRAVQLPAVNGDHFPSSEAAPHL